MGLFRTSSFIALPVLLLTMSASSNAQDRLGFAHDENTVSQIVMQMSDFSPDEAAQCQSAEDGLVQSCKYHEDCDTDVEKIYDAKIGSDYMEDRFIVFDVMSRIAESKADKVDTDRKFLQSLGLDPSQFEDQLVHNTSARASFDIGLMKIHRPEFDRAMAQHKMCLASIHEAASRVQIKSQKEAGNGN